MFQSPSATAAVLVPISLGELFDKISILEIKERRIAQPAKLANVRRELEALREVEERVLGRRSPKLRELVDELNRVNESLWDLEDAVRRYERDESFGPPFVLAARAVYRMNDRRSELKRAVSLRLGSPLLEEKDYAPFAEAAT
jgi:hypothetical protein